MGCRACGREERASEGYPCANCGTFICLICTFRGVTLCRECAAREPAPETERLTLGPAHGPPSVIAAPPSHRSSRAPLRAEQVTQLVLGETGDGARARAVTGAACAPTSTATTDGSTPATAEVDGAGGRRLARSGDRLE